MKTSDIDNLIKPAKAMLSRANRSQIDGGIGRDGVELFLRAVAEMLLPLVKRIEEQAAEIKDLQADLDRHIGRP